jgi:polyhydroxybutyrate depolymerase
MKKLLLLLCLPYLGMSQQLTTENILYDGNNREYIIYVPQNYSPSISTPILFAFHGGSGYAYDFMNYEADFRSISDTAGFILVYPQALEDPNDGNSTNWLHKEPTNHKDIFFIETLIDTIASEYNIDLNKIYACGYSLGGMFSYELACQLNNKIAAIASVAGAAFYGAFSSCNITHPTAVLSINGTADGIHPYNDQNGWYFSVADIDSFWAYSNNTDVIPIITQLPDLNTTDGSTVERYSWQNGDGCVSVEELKIINGGHDWPSPLSSWGNQDINANVELWNFLSKFDMSGLIGCSSTNQIDFNIVNSKSPIRIVDIFGKESKLHTNQLLFYIYDDGTVEKKIILE